MRRPARSALVIAAALAAGAVQAQTAPGTATAGSYSSEAAGPTLHAGNIWYTSSLPVVGDPPRSGRVQRVSWTWGLSQFPRAGIEVKLCYRSARDCIDVSRFGRGTTTAFAGRPADGRFQLMFRVPGKGKMMPVQALSNRVTVDYVY